MASLSERIQRLRTLRESGATEIMVDGETVKVDQNTIARELAKLEQQAGLRKRRKRWHGINLGVLFLAVAIIGIETGRRVDFNYQADVSTNGVQQFHNVEGSIFQPNAGGASTYDALNSGGKRKSAAGRVRHEDVILTSRKRERLSANANDIQRNIVLAAWAIRRHLDYVTEYDFCSCTGDKGLDRDVEWLMARDMKRRRNDVGERHNWRRMRRLLEARRTLAGDGGLLFLNLPTNQPGVRAFRTQGIESHQIKNPANLNKRTDRKRWRNGVRLGRGGRATHYCVHESTADGQRNERIVPAGRMFLHAAFEGRFQQSRGISAFPAAMKTFRDFDESCDYARAKIKVAQLVGLAFFREADSDDLTEDMPHTDAFTGDDDDDACDTTPREIDFSDGLGVLDLDDGERAEFINPDTPGGDTQDFLKLSIQIALKCFDIPYNFFDESHTNYFGSRAAWIGYERACKDKRESVQELNREYTLWRLRTLVFSGELALPRGWTLADLANGRRNAEPHPGQNAFAGFEWIPVGVPWWKPGEELDAELRSAGAHLDTYGRIARRHNLGDIYSNAMANKHFLDFCEANGVPFSVGKSAPVIFNPTDDDGSNA